MTMNDDDIDSLARSLDVAAPPAGFADRVMMTARARARPRALTHVAAALLGAAACFAMVALTSPFSAGEHDGTRVALSTPHGTLEGAQFIAEFNPSLSQAPEPTMFASSSSNTFPKSLATAAAGALIGAALTVAVTAGELTVTNDAGSATVKPGEIATLVDGAPPRVRGPEKHVITPDERAQLLRDENEGLRKALEAARSGDVTRVVAENQQLRDKLKKAEEEVALLDDLRKDQEGEPQKWPADLPPRFTEVALQKAFEGAMNEAGIEGGVVQIDCKEYPCLVYGQLSSKDDMEKLRETTAFAPYVDDDDRTSLWHSKKKDANGNTVERANFGVSLAPKPAAPGGDDDLNKRIRHRMQSTADALFPREG